MANDKPFFSATNSFRLSTQEQEEFNALFTSLHPQHRPKAMKELFVNMFRTFVNSLATQDGTAYQNEVNKAVDKDANGGVDKLVYIASNESFLKVNEGLNALCTEQMGFPVKVHPDDVLTAVSEYCLHEDYGKDFPTDEQVKKFFVFPIEKTLA